MFSLWWWWWWWYEHVTPSKITYIYQTAPRVQLPWLLQVCQQIWPHQVFTFVCGTSGWSNGSFRLIKCLSLWSLWRVLRKNSADCRCLLECLLISLGQPAEVKGHVFPYLSMSVYLWAVVAFPFNILGRCAVFIPFIQLVQLQQRRRRLIGVHLWKLKDFALHSSTDSRFICQKTCTICPCVIQSHILSLYWWLVQ